MLAADRCIEFALRGILSRRQSLGIRVIDVEYYSHSGHDPGCYNEAAKFLANIHHGFSHAMVVFDRHGSGHDSETREALEAKVEDDLRPVWGEAACTIVIDPELEAWVWSASPHVERVLGWEGRQPPLREWLLQNALLQEGKVKPPDPKKAVDRALRASKMQRSSAHFKRLAEAVSLDLCTDSSFDRLKKKLTCWFQATS